jgi:hypothetical protein
VGGEPNWPPEAGLRLLKTDEAEGGGWPRNELDELLFIRPIEGKCFLRRQKNKKKKKKKQKKVFQSFQKSFEKKSRTFVQVAKTCFFVSDTT